MTMSNSPEKPESRIRFGRRRRNRGRPAPEVIFVETDTHTLSLQISKYSDLHLVSEFFGSKTAGGINFFLLTNIMSAPALGKSATAQTTGDRQIRQTGTMRWPTNLSCCLSFFGEVQFVIDDSITQDAKWKATSRRSGGHIQTSLKQSALVWPCTEEEKQTWWHHCWPGNKLQNNSIIFAVGWKSHKPWGCGADHCSLARSRWKSVRSAPSQCTFGPPS